MRSQGNTGREPAIGTTGNGVPFVRMGDAPSLVVLNGGQGFVRQATPDRLLRDARRVARMLPEGRSFVLLGYDPRPAIHLSIEQVVATTGASVREVAPGGKVDLVGISYGGMVACRLAAQHPDLVRRLVLAASGHRFSAAGAEHVGRQLALLEAGDLTGFARAFAGLFRRRRHNWLVALALRLAGRRVASGMAPAPTIVRYLRAMRAAAPVALAPVDAPTLVIGGSADQFFGERIMADAAAAIPRGELQLLARETHMAPVEVAGAFRASIAAFLPPQPACA